MNGNAVIISACSHELVKDNENYIVNGNNVLIKNKTTGELMYVPINSEIKEIFGFQIYENLAVSSEASNNNNNKLKWTKNAILYLISLFKKYENRFKSTTEKNDKVWEALAEDMRKEKFHYSHTQCKDKWKYLKQKYMKKVDNMGDSASGAACLSFDYFEEMHEILRNKPNVIPTVVASSLQPESSHGDSTDVSVLEDSDEEPKRKKQKSTKNTPIVILLQNILEDSKQKEIARERRHQEIMKIRQDALNAYNDKMNELLKKI